MTAGRFDVTTASVPKRPHGALKANWGWLLALLLAAVWPLVSGDVFYIHMGVMVAITAVAVVGLVMIYRVGQLSFCHAAFVGIGAYAGAIFSTRFGLPFLASMAVAVLGVGVVAAALGWLILRTRGVYFVLITFAFGQVLGLMFLDLEPITGGAVGLSGIPAPSFAGFAFDTPFRYYYLALAALAITVLFVRRVLSSNIGHAFDAIANNMRLAESSGIATYAHQVLAFAIGSGLAAASGVLSAHYTRFVTPGSYETSFMVSLIVMLVLGGRTSVAGAVAGAIFLVPLAEILRDTKELENIIYGLVVLGVLRFIPGGIVSVPARLKSLLVWRKHTPEKEGL
ncbi:MAG: branched-chain amino acid ABC transporter permease [Janthinobacterium lividum]